ncbi:MAG: hypothetical protein ACI9Y7_002666 [Dokdonia sp.]
MYFELVSRYIQDPAYRPAFLLVKRCFEESERRIKNS